MSRGPGRPSKGARVALHLRAPEELAEQVRAAARSPESLSDCLARLVRAGLGLAPARVEELRWRVLDEHLRRVLVSWRQGDWHATVYAISADGTAWPMGFGLALPSRETAERAALAACSG